MPPGLAAFPQSRFPNDKPPTLFHPASPKLKPSKPITMPSKSIKDPETSSTTSTSTFASTASLLKKSVKPIFSKGTEGSGDGGQEKGEGKCDV